MSCMADVHEVQEANDKSKFHRQMKIPQKVEGCGYCTVKIAQS